MHGGGVASLATVSSRFEPSLSSLPGTVATTYVFSASDISEDLRTKATCTDSVFCDDRGAGIAKAYVYPTATASRRSSVPLETTEKLEGLGAKLLFSRSAAASEISGRIRCRQNVDPP
jgi:hypothetical protein